MRTVARALLFLSLSLVLSGAADPSVLVVCVSRERGRDVLRLISSRHPELRGRPAKFAAVGRGAPGKVLAALSWAQAQGLRVIGLDLGVYDPADAAVAAKLKELTAAGVSVEGLAWAELPPGQRVAERAPAPAPPAAAKRDEGSPRDTGREGYWSKSYAIPHRYRIYAARLAVNDARAAAAALSEWMTGLGAERAKVVGATIGSSAFTGQVTWPTANQLLWDLPPEAAARASKRLARFGRVESFEIRGPDPIPGYEDLYFKKQALEAEAARAGDALKGLPGASGLLQVQLKALGELIARHESAKARSVVYVTLVEPNADEKRLLDPGDLDNQFRQWPQPPDDATFWTRRGMRDNCQGTPQPVQAAVQAEDVPAAQAALRRLIEKRGGATRSIHCMPEHVWGLDGGGARFAYEAPAGQLEAIKRDLLKAWPGSAWEDKSARAWRKDYADAAEKVRILDGELRDGAGVLSGMPVLRSLVAAEDARLAPAARKSREAEKTEILDVFVVPAQARK